MPVSKDVEIELKLALRRKDVQRLFTPAATHRLTQRYFRRDVVVVQQMIDLVNCRNRHLRAAQLYIPELKAGQELKSARIRRVLAPDGSKRYYFTAKTKRLPFDPVRVELETPIDRDLYRHLKHEYAVHGYIQKDRAYQPGMIGGETAIAAYDTLLKIGREKHDVRHLDVIFAEIEVTSFELFMKLLDEETVTSFQWLLDRSVRIPPGVEQWRALSMSRMARDGYSDNFHRALGRLCAEFPR